MRYLPALLVGLALSGWSSAQARDNGQAVSPEIGRPIQAAIELLKAKRAGEALARVREVQALAHKSPYESYLVDRVLGQAAAAAGETATAARAYEAVANSPAAPQNERRQFLLAAASQYYLAKEYAKSADLSGRYLSQGGGDKAVRALHAQALYLSNHFAAAAKALASDVEAEEQSGKAPGEEQLQLLANAYLRQRDSAGYGKAMEKLIAHHPKRDYWLAVLHGIASRPGFAATLAVDVARLKLATGTMRTAGEYLESAQLVLQDGFPLEAAKIIEQGYAAGLLGVGADAERHKRLKDLVARNLTDDRKSLAQEAARATGAKDCRTTLNDGYNYVLHGRSEKGLAMMEQCLKLGTGLRRPDHAKLQLAYAYHLAGQDRKAIQVYGTVQGADGAAGIARLWSLHLSRNGAL